MSRLPLAALAAMLTSGCASAAPFSVITPGLQTLLEEEEHAAMSPEEAMAALAGVTLRDRVENLMSTYQEELGRARQRQGGALNTTLSVFGLILPVSGTISAIALSDPDDIQTVGIVTGVATTAIMGLNLILKPQAKSAEARRCASFLESALDVHRRRWSPGPSMTLTGTAEEWTTYFTMQATLQPLRLSACGR